CLRTDQVVVADLLGHHLEQQAILVGGERGRLARVLNAGNRLLDGRRAARRGGRRLRRGSGGGGRRGGDRGPGGAAGGGRGGGRGRLGQRGGRQRHGLESGCPVSVSRDAEGRPDGLAPVEFAVAFGIERQVGRLVGELDLARQLLAQQLAEAARASPAGADGLLVSECPHGPFSQSLEPYACPRGANAT